MAFKQKTPLIIGLEKDVKIRIEEIAKEKNVSQAEVIRNIVDYMLSSPLELQIALDAQLFKKAN